MKTDELIAMLARGAEPVDPGALRQRYAAALGWGLFGAALLMAILLGVRSDLGAAALLPMFWVKLAFPAALLAAGLLTVVRLSRPGVRLGRLPTALAAPVLAMWLLAAAALLAAPSGGIPGLIFGATWMSCPFSIALLSIPLFLALLWAMRGLAPTRPALAGAAVGLAAGAAGALVYALHCPELAAPFIAVWYVLGILIPVAAGAVIGARALRW